MIKKFFKVINLLSSFIAFEKCSFETFLKKIIAVLEKIIKVDSYLIYLYDQKEEKLILVGSKKPHKNLLGKITLKKGEGITGWVAENKKLLLLKRKLIKIRDLSFFVNYLKIDMRHSCRCQF